MYFVFHLNVFNFLTIGGLIDENSDVFLKGILHRDGPDVAPNAPEGYLSH